MFFRITYQITDYDIMCSYPESADICADSLHEAVEILKKDVVNDHISIKLIRVQEL